MTISLRGMTWSHPRGYDPLVAAAAVWQARTGVVITWDKRSLQDFETFPVEELARQYDMIVIDHPHVGQITDEGCLTPLDVPGREAEREDMAKHSVGKSYPSYFWKGHQWAFPIDAATQVLTYRPDLATAPKTWSEVIGLARQGRVLLPLRSPHSLMCLYTLSANLGRPCNTEKGPLLDQQTGEKVIGMLAEIAALVEPRCFAMDPIDVFEAMAAEGSRYAIAPLIYGYVNYALDGFRPQRLHFSDIPVAGAAGPIGSALGGTGLAVSALRESREAAIDFAYWVASAPVQSGLYAEAGGQPGHGNAWEADTVNAPVSDFYRATRATLEGAWLRPRHNGYMDFQSEGSDRLSKGLKTKEAPASILAALNELFEKSF